MFVIVKFGQNCEIWSKLWNLVKIVKFGRNYEIWSKLWNLVKIVKFGQNCEICWPPCLPPCRSPCRPPCSPPCQPPCPPPCRHHVHLHVGYLDGHRNVVSALCEVPGTLAEWKSETIMDGRTDWPGWRVGAREPKMYLKWFYFIRWS